MRSLNMTGMLTRSAIVEWPHTIFGPPTLCHKFLDHLFYDYLKQWNIV